MMYRHQQRPLLLAPWSSYLVSLDKLLAACGSVGLIRLCENSLSSVWVASPFHGSLLYILFTNVKKRHWLVRTCPSINYAQTQPSSISNHLKGNFLQDLFFPGLFFMERIKPELQWLYLSSPTLNKIFRKDRTTTVLVQKVPKNNLTTKVRPL